MSHYHDADIKKALLEVSPDAKELIESLKFGEISHGYIQFFLLQISETADAFPKC